MKKSKRQIKRDAHYHIHLLIDSALAAGAEWGLDTEAEEEYYDTLCGAIDEISQYHHNLGWTK